MDENEHWMELPETSEEVEWLREEYEKMTEYAGRLHSLLMMAADSASPKLRETYRQGATRARRIAWGLEES